MAGVEGLLWYVLRALGRWSRRAVGRAADQGADRLGEDVAAGAANTLARFLGRATRGGQEAQVVRVGLIPARAQSFQRRRLVDELRGTGRARAAGCVVLSGLTGAGKTQSAAEYARDLWESREVDVLVWVTAKDRSAIESGYAQAGVEICGADPAGPARAAERFLVWLGSGRGRWLVVLDDVVDPQALRGLWPPDHPAGQTVITTTLQHAALRGADRRWIAVESFTRDESLTYLRLILRAHEREESTEDLDGLAEDLRDLPLVLSQAAAYLIDNVLTVKEYRRLLADTSRKLADLLPRAEEGLPDDQNWTWDAVWLLSLDRAGALSRRDLVRPVLDLAALLDPDGIPEDVLTSEPARSALSRHSGDRQVTADEVRDALRLLSRFSLVDRSRPGDGPVGVVRIHQLVQRGARDRMPAPQKDALALGAAYALAETWPNAERDAAFARMLRANAVTLIATAGEPLYGVAHEVLFRLGRSLAEVGQLGAARDYCHDLAIGLAAALGPDHRAVLRARGDEAYWRGDAGDPVAAAADTGALLEDQERVLGPDDPDTQGTRHNKAYWLMVNGDPAGAVIELTLLRRDRYRVLGEEHKHAITTDSLLARSHGEAGSPERAVAGLKKVLADRTRLLGSHDPATLFTRVALAQYLGEAGRPDLAVAELTVALPEHLAVMSPDDPRVFNARAELARWQGEVGASAATVAALTELLGDCERALEASHPLTAEIRQLLDFWRSRLENDTAPNDGG